MTTYPAKTILDMARQAKGVRVSITPGSGRWNDLTPIGKRDLKKLLDAGQSYPAKLYPNGWLEVIAS